jgi:hypothetical protein
MLFLAKKTLNEYKSPSFQDGSTIIQVAHNLEFFSNLKVTWR